MASRQEMGKTSRSTAVVPVWDPLVRFGHWALVVSFAVAYLSAEEEAGGPDPLHVWGGYVVGAIVILRVLWGFLGPLHARFSDFVCGPVTALGYLKDLLLGRARRHLGHSPAGGAMVLALLVCLAATVTTGVMAQGEQGKGPLGGVALATGADVNDSKARSATRAERQGEGVENAMGELHGVLANITLALVALHLLGVAVASFAHRENLVLAMISGKKRGEHAIDAR
jgi:cytochrome b